MKLYFKILVLGGIFLMSSSNIIWSQTTRSNKNTRTSTTTKNAEKTKRIANHISRSNVTYKKNTKKVTSVRNLPNKRVINHNGVNYYYANQKYYTYSRGRYINIAPKIGFRVNSLPNHYNRVVFNNRVFYNANGIFYIEINNSYEVVEPEIGTIVSELPSEAEKVNIDGFTYYEFANVLYEKIQINGTRAFEVVSIIQIE